MQDRVRTISASAFGPIGEESRLVDMVYHDIARGIVQKLKEFKKYEIIETSDGLIHVHCDLSLIVPYPSKETAK